MMNGDDPKRLPEKDDQKIKWLFQQSENSEKEEVHPPGTESLLAKLIHQQVLFTSQVNELLAAWNKKQNETLPHDFQKQHPPLEMPSLDASHTSPLHFITYGTAMKIKNSFFSRSQPLPPSFFQSREWHLVNALVEQFKASIYDLAYQLQKSSHEEISERQREECFEIMNRLNDSLQDMNQSLEGSSYLDYAFGYIFKEIFPYFLRSHFVERIFYKPKGYAGDFMMIEMLYQNAPSGDGKLGTLIDEWCLNTTNGKAIRSRRVLLKNLLHKISRQFHVKQKHVDILNLACGASRELFDFLHECNFTDAIKATCVDIDIDALEFVNRNVNVFPHMASIKLIQDDILRWVFGHTTYDYATYDIIYSSGLTDYFNKRIFQSFINRCYEHLNPGGILIVGNFSKKNPHRVFMDYIVLWKLKHRSARELKEVFAGTKFGPDIKIVSESHTINYFAIAKKPGG